VKYVWHVQFDTQFTIDTLHGPTVHGILTHYSGRVTQICVFNTVKLGTSASSP